MTLMSLQEVMIIPGFKPANAAGDSGSTTSIPKPLLGNSKPRMPSHQLDYAALFKLLGLSLMVTIEQPY